jgi:hypothetical protein
MPLEIGPRSAPPATFAKQSAHHFVKSMRLLLFAFNCFVPAPGTAPLHLTVAAAAAAAAPSGYDFSEAALKGLSVGRG